MHHWHRQGDNSATSAAGRLSLVASQPQEVDVHAQEIVVHGAGARFRHIDEFHGSYDPLQYPLLFPLGERGWDFGNDVSLNGIVKYLLFERDGVFSHLHAASRLFQVFVVDQFAKIDQQRLRFIKDNQARLRQDTYQSFADAVARQRSVAPIGIRSILPSTFTGSRRDMLGRFHDAMAIVRRLSHGSNANDLPAKSLVACTRYRLATKNASTCACFSATVEDPRHWWTCAPSIDK